MEPLKMPDRSVMHYRTTGCKNLQAPFEGMYRNNSREQRK